MQAAPIVINGIPSDATQWLSGERAILTAILAYGAVASTMRVYADFLNYVGGVYKLRSADYQGKSAVQLIGWGVEPKSGTPYWIAEGNFGPKWGENQKLQACSVRDCTGEFCPLDNLNPTCSDSAMWRDKQGFGCAWYTQNDPGCALFKDTGQRANCKQSCKTCDALPLPDGELCGYFRILRGVNHCSIEELAAHGFAHVYSPSSEFTSASNGNCVDQVSWNDGFGRGCDWYAGRQCKALPDVGQLFNCPASCGTCGMKSRLQRASDGWQAAGSAHRFAQLSAWSMVALSLVLQSK